MLADVFDLPRRPWREVNHLTCVHPLSASLSSTRARLSRKPRITTSPGTIWPAAISASLSSRMFSQPCALFPEPYHAMSLGEKTGFPAKCPADIRKWIKT